VEEFKQQFNYLNNDLIAKHIMILNKNVDAIFELPKEF
jgi:hypothetical protein